MGTNADEETVSIDDRGRITLPKHVRDRLRLGEGDELALELADGEIRLRPGRPDFEPIESGHARDGDAFLDAGEAMVGDPEEDDVDR